MEVELKIIGLKFLAALVVTPLMGYVLLKTAQYVEKAWKSNNRGKQWFAMCGVFLLLAAISGWFL